MLSKKKFFTFIDTYYFQIILATLPLTLWLNKDHIIHEKIQWHDLNFKKIILSGFDQTIINTMPTPTFPMWGQSWIVLFTENPFILLSLNVIIYIAALYFFIKTIKRYKILPNNAFYIFIIILSTSFYTFAQHVRVCPKSLGISLLLLALSFLLHALHIQKNRWYLILSGICFGLMLNFRSDYWLVPIGLSFLFLIKKKFSFKKIILWNICIYSMMIPWIWYSHKATGHYSLTSTNAGHVCFIGLGNLPNNKWGIISGDHDPHMHEILKEKFPDKYSKKYFSCSYPADQFLKKKWVEYIKKDPIEYIKKCFYAIFLYCFHGLDRGHFFHTAHQASNIKYVKNIINNLFFYATKKPTDLIRLFFLLLTHIHTTIITTASIIMLIWLIFNIHLISTSLLIFLLLFMYQFTFIILCGFQNTYSNTIFLPLITLLSFWIDQLCNTKKHIKNL